MPYKVGILTASDRCHAKIYEDAGGSAIKTYLSSPRFDVVAHEVVPDDATAISGMLRLFADEQKLDLVLTTGGTGLGPRDVTPEATASVCNKMVPGLAEWIRNESARRTPMAALSRGAAGMRGRTLIINLPGQPKAVDECMALLMPVLPHAFAMIAGEGHEYFAPSP